MENAYFYDTVIGKVLITEDGESITGLLTVTSEEALESCPQFSERYRVYESVLLKNTAKQLEEYLCGRRKEFDVKLNPRGTEFQKRVWDALKKIPYGETRSYKQIAEAAGNVKAARAVGMANHNNPIMCIIPCHRVIGADGSLVGFGGGLNIKEQLLNLEKEHAR